MLSIVNECEDTITNKNNEDLDVTEGDLGNLHEHNTQPDMVEKLDNPVMETSWQGVSIFESNIFEGNHPNSVDISNNMAVESHSENLEQELPEQPNTKSILEQKGTSNNVIHYKASLADANYFNSNTDETNIDTKENKIVETNHENEDKGKSLADVANKMRDSNKTSNSNTVTQSDGDVNEERNNGAIETEEEQVKKVPDEDTTEGIMQGVEFDCEGQNEGENLAGGRENDVIFQKTENLEEEENNEKETGINVGEPDARAEKEFLEKLKKMKRGDANKSTASKQKEKSNKLKSTHNLDEALAAKKTETEIGKFRVHFRFLLPFIYLSPWWKFVIHNKF